MIRKSWVFNLVVFVVCVACSISTEDIRIGFLNATSVEEANAFARKAYSLRLQGIPIFLDVINKSIENQDSLLNYGKLQISLKYMYELASNGVYSKRSVPVLLRVIKKQRSIADTLVTANTIKIITGVDVGYDYKFVQSYSSADEEKRLKMISKWEAINKSNKRGRSEPPPAR